ncbi:MAG: DUF4351 domain-containing protein [Chloroflexi bacterium]|nr:DUF4351 domain-containing protein [Chloroflexota bacterium]
MHSISQYNADISQTLFIYSAELTDRMKMPVATVVIYSERRRPEQRPKNEYIVRVGDQVINRFIYPDMWLIDYEEQIRSGELAPLAPFLLEIVARPTAETVQTAKSLVSYEPDLERRSLLLSLVALLAGRYFDRETIRRLFRQELEMIRTNTFIDEWLEDAEQKGVEKGRREGHQEGRQEGQWESLVRLLEHRFGSVPAELILRTKDLKAEELVRLFDLALEASSLAEIEQAVNSTLS